MKCLLCERTGPMRAVLTVPGAPTLWICRTCDNEFKESE
jgi:hypothetical protein